ncbi:MAG: flagellar hook protein FlgE [Pseudomonadota bacterium]
MALANSLSGLIAAAKALDVVGNNIANSQTIGFKSSIARFTNVSAAGKSSGPSDTGSSAGVSADNIFQQFGQGQVELSDKPLDMAINGLGFFRLYNPETNRVSYTRDGQFGLAFEGDGFAKLVTRTGLCLTGNVPSFGSDPFGTIAATPAPVPLVIDPFFPPRATAVVNASLNLDVRVAAPTAPFDAADPLTYNGSASSTVFDAAGAAHDLRVYFVKPGPASVWQVYSTLDYNANAVPAQVPTVSGPIDLAFDLRGAVRSPMPSPVQSYTLPGGANVAISFDFTGTTQNVDYSSTTQFGTAFSVNALAQDGYTAGRIQDPNEFNVQADGRIIARFSNGQQRTVAQLVLANFANPNALINTGDNQWVANEDPLRGTGAVSLGFPKFSTEKLSGFAGDSDPAEGMGSIQGRAREMSNVDLATELVSLIEQQRNYQASAQTFKILDQVLQNLANMRSN